MKAGDIIAVSNNPLIMIATVSNVSHVAIAMNEHEVVEIMPGNLRRIRLDECIKNCLGAAIYSRPGHLPELNSDALEAEYIRMLGADTKYSKIRMLYSGLIPSVRNIMHGMAMLIALAIYLGNSPGYALIIVLLLAYSPAVYLAQKISARMAVSSLRSYKLFDVILRDIPGEFCSSLVVGLDDKSGGKLKSMINKNHEPRPSDVINACVALKYQKVKLK